MYEDELDVSKEAREFVAPDTSGVKGVEGAGAAANPESSSLRERQAKLLEKLRQDTAHLAVEDIQSLLEQAQLEEKKVMESNPDRAKADDFFDQTDVLAALIKERQEGPRSAQ